MADITFYRSLAILMTALTASLCETLRLSNDQISVFMLDFESRLPKHLQNSLHPKPKTAQIIILLAEILNFQCTNPILGVGSLSKLNSSFSYYVTVFIS